MNDSRGFLHPEVLAQIQRLELRARSVVEGVLSGNHRSPFFGQSIEFAQHRPYVAGDDLRHVDWKVWARQDRLYVKQFEEETDLRCTLMLDISPSMQYGSGTFNKLQYAATLGSSLAWLVQRQQDAVGLVTFDDQVRDHLPQRTSQSALSQLIGRMEQAIASAEVTGERAVEMAEDETESAVEPVFRQAVSWFPKRGLWIILSDLLTDLDSLKQGLRGLAASGNEILVLHVMDDDELDFPFDRPSQFLGLESSIRLRCHPRELRENYLREVHRYLEQVREIMSSCDVDYRLTRTSESLSGALTAFLSHRARRLGR